jgi:adenine-specific DNA-methyltransferase
MNALKKFQELLRDIFQFESSDLDFGIYRILNYKQKEIKEFIDQKLPQIIEDAFQKHKKNLSENIHEEYERERKNVIEGLGEDAITPTGELNPAFANTPLGKKYLRIKEQKELLEKLEEIKEQVYNDLYSFFSRFYEDGDFIPQYRYSKEPKYSIPYNGEEVKLYWVNADQYYIKTGILFKDYTFKVWDKKVIFRTVSAREEINSNKATKQRYFVLDEEPIQIDQEGIIIRFQYKELSQEEIKLYEDNGKGREVEQKKENGGRGIGIKQEKINGKIFEGLKKELMEISSKIKDFLFAIKSLLEEQRNQQPLLLYHINRFTAKNTRDYFIHKNLRKFLMGQLDYFIKSEVLNYETLSEEKYLDKHITRAKVVKEVGEKIIDFLAQIEDFQKKLWEKKKFVIQTHYVITLDRIKEWAGEEFYREVLKKVLQNNAQLEEWERLGFGKFESEWDLVGKKLPIDTRYFDESFKWKLLERISEKVNLDDELDGLLIKSENWQALNTILNRYKEKVQTIYIDPPFNKEQDADYLYNVKYKDSTWIAMLENRLRLAKELLNERGSIFVRCDYNGNMYVRLLMNEIFGEENFRNEIIVKRGGAPISLLFKQFGELEKLGITYDNLFWFSKAQIKVKIPYRTLDKKREGHWANFYKSGLFYDRPTMRYELLGIKIEKGQWLWSKERAMQAVKNYEDYLKEKEKSGITLEEYWEKTGKKLEFVRRNGDKIEYWIPPKEREILDNNWLDIPGYSYGWGFATENSEILLKRVIESTSEEGDLVMDFFLGSGTTTAVAHKLKRKWIGVEMGEHFWTVVMPRMKKVLSYDKTGISKEKDVKEKYNERTAGGFFKYIILEQYEDTLDNLELKESKAHRDFFKDDYLIKYFLEIETKDDPHLLNISMLKDPYNYKLKVNLSEVGEPKEMAVDVIETFNYLLGLKINKLMRKEREGNIYTFVLGEKEGKSVAVVWRVYSERWKEEDYKKDRDFIEEVLKEFKPEIIYINGQHALAFESFKPDVRNVEPEFKRRMFSHEH